MKLSIYEIIVLVLIAIITVAVWASRPPRCEDGSPKGPAIGSVVRIAGC